MRKLASAAICVGALVCALIVPLSGAESAGAKSAPLVIGEICSCTGAFASSEVDDVPTLKAWVSATNAKGGINGHPVQIIYDDDDTNPATSLTEVTKMVTNNHILALIDNTDVDSSWATYASQQGVPVIGGGLGSSLYYTDPNFFPEGQTLDALVTSFAAAAGKAKSSKAAFFYCAESPGCALSIPPLRAQLPEFNSSLAYVTSISYAAPNYTAQCLAAKQSGATSLIIADAVSVVQSAAGDCDAQGWVPTDIVDGSAVDPAMAKTPGLNNNLLVIQSDLPFSATSNPQIKAMDAALRKYSPSVLTSPEFGEGVVFQWVTALEFQAAVEANQVGSKGAPTAAQVKTGLLSFHNNTLDGTAPPLTFKKGKPHSVDCWFWMRMKAGKFITPYGLKPQCHSVAG